MPHGTINIEVPEGLKEYLTFYHELRIPRHRYFREDYNYIEDNRLLVVTSPSRMGNHLVLSVLDGHPSLPTVPGEDGFLSFSFAEANYDVRAFVQSLRGNNALEYVLRLGSNGGRDKWWEFKKLYEEQDGNARHSGIEVDDVPNIVDYEGVVFDIDYEGYRRKLEDNLDRIRSSKAYNEVLEIYLGALRELLGRSEREMYDSLLVFSGMRTQAMWLCRTYQECRILSSLRSFSSYAVSHVKSRQGDVPLTDERVKAAWEHWYHKVIDMLYLRVHYPEQVGLVTYDELVNDPELAHRGICNFLGIEFEKEMQTATINGIPVRGNSWRDRSNGTEGEFYTPGRTLNSDRVPPEASDLWSAVKLLSVTEAP